MEKCNNCGHLEVDPDIREVEMTDQGYTIKIGVWDCRSCGTVSVASFSLPVDENGNLITPKK